MRIEKCLSSTPVKNGKKLCNLHKKKEVHIFNVWTIIVQSLTVKEWKLLELQITQTRDALRILDGKNSKSNNRKKWENIYQMRTKWNVHIFNMWTIIMQSLNKKEAFGVTDYTN